MTVRLDPGQHGRLRILAALQRCTSQEIVVRALEAYIRANGSDCACLGRSGPPERRD
jgi:predicted transcriptional regulator